MTERRQNRVYPNKKLPMSPAGVLIRTILSDGQWHDYELLVGWVAASGLVKSNPRWDAKKQMYVRLPPERLARDLVLSVARQNGYEVQSRRRGQTHRIQAVRKKPDMGHGQTLRTCSLCGASDLGVADRIRRIVEYRIPRRSKRKLRPEGKHSGLGDVVAAKLPTQYLCLPCADTELSAVQAQWRVKPPFDYSGEEVNRGEVNPDSYYQQKYRRGERPRLRQEDTGTG